MIPLPDLLIFAAAALLMVLTPGPNMIYLISRSICQGRKAGVTSLLGGGGGVLRAHVRRGRRVDGGVPGGACGL